MGLFKDSYGDWYTWTIFALILGWLPLLLVGLVFVSDCGGANGHHTGYVTAVEVQENVTWDSDVAYFKSSTESTQEDTYCVRDPELRQRLEWYSRTRRLVTIHYQNNLVLWRWQCNGGTSIIIGVEPEEPMREPVEVL